jgi:aspartyl-tRNA(Asn)/glutamyl-tRNA(Gln) amidotransferase subunit C
MAAAAAHCSPAPLTEPAAPPRPPPHSPQLHRPKRFRALPGRIAGYPCSRTAARSGQNGRATGWSTVSEITTETITHLADLARIALTPAEIETLTGELGAIVDSVAKVSEVATADVVATSHPIPLGNVFRNDVPGVTLTTEQALAGAPEHDGSRFKVSAILGEEQ